MALNMETMSKIVNLMSANDYTTTARTWAQAKAIVEPMDLLPTEAELNALNSGNAPAWVTTLSGLSLANKMAAVAAQTYPGYMIYSWPRLTGLG